MFPDTMAAACIPVSYRNAYVTIETDNDLRYLGKENLQFLARFWEACAVKARSTRDATVNAEEWDRLDGRARSANDRSHHLRSLSKTSISKPRLFERPTYRVGSKVTCFMENPDRFISGTLSEINGISDASDEENEDVVQIQSATFTIKVYDANLPQRYREYTYVPDGLTLYPTEDFEYYRHHPSYFNMTLRYHITVMTPTESAYINRIMDALHYLAEEADEEDDTI